ncbi:hypothetical protein IMY05_C4498000900 [Salix suchowensis]|nr:hypothetical protein IMY05_C4498000900 [Salix suchowensis]
MWECRMIYAGSVDAETKLNLFKGSRAQRKNRKQPRIVFNEIIGFHLKRLDTASSKQRGDPKRLQRREWRGRGSVAADVQFAQILESLETVRKPSWNLCEVGVVEDQMEVEDVLSKMGAVKWRKSSLEATAPSRLVFEIFEGGITKLLPMGISVELNGKLTDIVGKRELIDTILCMEQITSELEDIYRQTRRAHVLAEVRGQEYRCHCALEDELTQTGGIYEGICQGPGVSQLKGSITRTGHRSLAS